MPAYENDTVRVVGSAIALDGVTIVEPSMVSSVTCQIWFSGTTPPTEIITPTSMTWDSVNKEWYFDWTTTGETPGAYRAAVVIIGLGATPDFQKREYTTIRLKADKIISGSV